MPKTQELVSSRKPFTNKSSRFKFYPVLDDNNKEFFATYYPFKYPFSAEDIYHEIGPGEEGRLYLIAKKYYRDERLWWVIAEANSIVHPIKEAVPGLVLRIPSVTYVFNKVAV